MNEDTGAGRIRAQPSLRRAGVLSAALVGIVLLSAACGGSGGGGSPTSAAGGQPGSGSQYQQMAAYSQCMQSHGAPDFPEPAKGPGGGYGYLMTPQLQGKLTGPAFNAAKAACKKLQPKGGMTPAERQTALDALLKFAQCMRAHGLPNFPDPTTNGGGIQIQMNNPYDANSQQFKSAQQGCRAYAPSLP